MWELLLPFLCFAIGPFLIHTPTSEHLSLWSAQFLWEIRVDANIWGVRMRLQLWLTYISRLGQDMCVCVCLSVSPMLKGSACSYQRAEWGSMYLLKGYQLLLRHHTLGVWLNDLGNSPLLRLSIGWLVLLVSNRTVLFMLCEERELCDPGWVCLHTFTAHLCSGISVCPPSETAAPQHRFCVQALSPSSSHSHSLQAEMLPTREKEMKVFSPTTCSGGSCFPFPQKCGPSIREERCSPSAWWPKSTAVNPLCKWLRNCVCVVAKLLFG